MSLPSETDQVNPPLLDVDSLQGAKIDNNVGSNKTLYEHRSDPHKLVLKAERKGSWKKEYFNSKEWTPEAEYHYYCLLFYARKLAHRLKPEFFPDCYLADPTTLIVENIENGQTKGIDSLPSATSGAFKQACRDIGLNFWAVDTAGDNFVETATNAYYVDDLIDEIYFVSLGRMLKTGSFWGHLPEEDREKAAELDHQLGTFPQGPRIFNREKLLAAIEKTFPPDNPANQLNYWGTRQLAQRFFHHVESLPQMPLMAQT